MLTFVISISYLFLGGKKDLLTWHHSLCSFFWLFSLNWSIIIIRPDKQINFTLCGIFDFSPHRCHFLPTNDSSEEIQPEYIWINIAQVDFFFFFFGLYLDNYWHLREKTLFLRHQSPTWMWFRNMNTQVVLVNSKRRGGKGSEILCTCNDYILKVTAVTPTEWQKDQLVEWQLPWKRAVKDPRASITELLKQTLHTLSTDIGTCVGISTHGAVNSQGEY